MGPEHDKIPAMDIARALFQGVIDLLSLLFLLTRSRSKLAAETLFLRKQLAMYKKRGIKPGRIDSATKLTLMSLSKLFNWKDSLVVIQPKTLVRWHREGFRLLWRWKSRKGWPQVSEDLRKIIRQIARKNLLWGEERIANDLLLKLDIKISLDLFRNTYRKASYPNWHEFAEAYTEKEIGSNSTKWDAYVINYNKVRTENPK